MPADFDDIAAATRAAAVATWSDGLTAGRYPNARDGTVTPAPGFFDRIDDAQAVANARGVLIGAERRRFAVDIEELVWPDVESGVPTVRLVDDEQRADLPCLTARIEIDLDAETTSLELFG
ncbi:hypothetical protein GCM10022253_27840 [Sphingomonas endophytica]|uniref:Uncharacterized protein n=1 Tax=Sphingomonas endophytica TaxID=869719 RepID=A0ABR6N8I2_9SPHN|nr:hypothetical protein [Sphingomonas endophytica]MBB5727086.1 hypothetical protein [Sphingomonas endophytica]